MDIDVGINSTRLKSGLEYGVEFSPKFARIRATGCVFDIFLIGTKYRELLGLLAGK